MSRKVAPIDLIKKLAKRHRGRLSVFKLSDRNVWRGEEPYEAHGRWPPPDLFTHRLRLKHRGRSITLYPNAEFVRLEVDGDFRIEGAFSVNRPAPVIYATRRLLRTEGLSSWPVFVPDYRRWPGLAHLRSPTSLPAVLKRHDVRRAIEALEFGPREGMTVYGNGVCIYARPDSEERLEGLLKGAITIVQALPEAQKRVVGLSRLPPRFRRLVPLIRKWARDDDDERAELLSKASRIQVEKLVQRVTPFLDAIDKYLDGFVGTPPEFAGALGNLAECALEAKARLTV